MSDPDIDEPRQLMVAEICAQTIFLAGRLGKVALDRRVPDVMGNVPRHEFVRLEWQPLAYADTPLPMTHAQQLLLVIKGADDTISTRDILPARFSLLEDPG